MRSRPLLWLILILIALSGYLIFIEIPQEQIKRENKIQENKIFTFGKEDVTAIQLEYPDSSITLKKSGENLWEMTNPITAEGDPSEINSLISTVTSMRLKRVVEEVEQDPSIYGLDHPNLEMILSHGDGKESIILGDDAPMANTLYIKRGSDRRIFLVEQWIKGSLTRSVFDLRNKRILSFDPETSTEIALDFPSESFLILKENDEWVIKKPREGLADSRIIDNLLRSLKNLRATRFIDDLTEKEEIRKKLGNADLVALIGENGANPSISFYRASDQKEVYVVTTTPLPIYTIQESTFNEIKSDLFNYQDKKLLVFDEGAIGKIEVQGSSDSYSLRWENETWNLEGRTDIIDNEAVVRFLNHLKDLKAEEKPISGVPPDMIGLVSPVTTIRLYSSDGNMISHLDIGNEEGNKLYAKGIPGLGTVLISVNILDKIPRVNELLLSQLPEES